MKTTKRILALLMCMAMILGMIPMIASAEGETYKKVTSAAEITSGQYVMINAAGYAPTSFNTKKDWLLVAKPTVDGDNVTDTAGAVITLTVDGTSVKIQDASGLYVAPKTGNNNGIQNKEYSWNMVVAADGTVQFKGTGSDTTILASNKQSSYQIRAYKTSTATNETNYPTKFTLYKLAEAADPDAPVCEHTKLNAAIHVDGKHVVTCADCGEAQPTEEVITTTYTDDDHTATCSCGEYSVTEAHTLSGWTVKTPATAAAPGEEIKTCSGCAYTESQEIAQLPIEGNHYIKYSNATLLSGTYIMIAGEHTLGAFDNGWILPTTAPVIDENTVADDMGGVWTLTVTDAGVILTDANGVTVAPKAGDNNGILASAYVWAWAYDEATGTYSFSGVGSDTTKLALNTEAVNGQNRFRSYKTSTLTGKNADDYISAFTLYKLEGEQSCAHETAYTTTATTHIAYCSKCSEVFIEETWHDMKGENGTCSVCDYEVDSAVLTATWLELLFALESGEKLEGNYMLTGTVTEINYTFDTSYKNMSVTIAIEGYDNTVYCYHMKCTADQAAAMYVDAVITVEGPFENYNGTYEINGGTLISMVPCEHKYDYDCDADCNICGATREASHQYAYPCDPVCMICYEITNPDATHTIVAVEAKEATCTAEGNVAYWYCSDCGAAWTDEALTQVTNLKSVKIPMADHVYAYPCDPVCMICYELTNPDAAHNIVAVEAKAATCTENGNIAYWCCEHCGAAWTDEALTQVTNLKSVVIPAPGHTYDNNCDADCNVCEEFRDAPHNLENGYVAAVVPANCKETGHNEYWTCADCGGYFMSNGMGGYYETNPAWINYTGDHVRPEGTPGCAVVACELCGEDSYGTEACDRGDAPACQDATCVNCGDIVYGQGHSYGYDEDGNPLTPLCQAGDCIYCGEHLDYIYECENNVYATCSVDGECVYGCGKQYPATGVHSLDDPCTGGTCWLCWTEIAGAHNYVDGACSVCGEADPDAPTGPIADANLTFLGGAAISFQDYIGMNIMFYNGTAANYDKFYAIAVQVDPDGNSVETLCNVVPYSYEGYDYTIFEHPVMSWSMTEQVTLTLYAEKDGVVYVGQSITTSVQALALEKLATYAAANNTVNCAALVDMLNYGAAVQVNQNHFADSLPSAGDYASYGTTTTPEFNATNSVTGDGIVGYGPSISMQAKVEFNVMYYGADLEGNTVKAFVDGEEVEVLYNYDAAPGWPIARIVIKASQMRSTFTIAVYDADGNVVSQVIETSIEACAQTHLGGANNDLVIALMNYGDSVSKVG